jgi:hypothetical protein
MADIRVDRSPRATGVDRKRSPRLNQVMVRFTDEGADILDKLRGDKSRQDYLRDLVAAEYLAAKKKGRI